MKIHTLTIVLVFSTLFSFSQVSQDSINELQAKINHKQSEVNAVQKGINKEQAKVNAMQMEVNKEQLAVNALQEEVNKKSNAENEALIRNILNDLVAMKIISNKEKVSFGLSIDKMEVNNKKQSSEVHKLFVEKYKIVQGYAIAYSKENNNTTTSITKS